MLETVAEVWPEMPSGLCVTPAGRIFLSFPRWLDRRAFTVAELVDGRLHPYPDATTNQIDVRDAVHRLFSVQSVVATDDETVWALDAGRPMYLPAIPGAAKLVEIDARANRIRRVYAIPPGIARLRTYLNDVRIDPARGAAGTAYISDSGTLLSRCGIIVIDLATGRKLRRLDGHPSVQPRLGVVPVIEGRRLAYRLPFVPLGLPYQNGVDGIACDPSGTSVYYCPLSSRTLYRVDAAALADPAASDDDVACTIVDAGTKPVSDGLESDAAGTLYTGDLENRRLVARNGRDWTTLVQDPALLWIDSLCATGGYLYATVNQIERLAPFNGLRDRRKPPYRIVRTALPARDRIV
jgi:sugar lactone lactonase YvrE